jgi:hypothetical protein
MFARESTCSWLSKWPTYREYFDPGHTTGALFVVNPDGSHPTQITKPGDGNLDTNLGDRPVSFGLPFDPSGLLKAVTAVHSI